LRIHKSNSSRQPLYAFASLDPGFGAACRYPVSLKCGSGGRSTSRMCYDYAAVPVACPTHALALGHTPERVSPLLAHDAITVKVRRVGLPPFSV